MVVVGGGRKEARVIPQPFGSRQDYSPTARHRVMASSSAQAAKEPGRLHQRLTDELSNFRMELYKKSEAKNIAEREEEARKNAAASKGAKQAEQWGKLWALLQKLQVVESKTLKTLQEAEEEISSIQFEAEEFTDMGTGEDEQEECVASKVLLEAAVKLRAQFRDRRTMGVREPPVLSQQNVAASQQATPRVQEFHGVPRHSCTEVVLRGKPIGLPDSSVTAAFGGGDVVRGIRSVGHLTFITLHTPHGCNEVYENIKGMLQREGWTSASVARSNFQVDTHLHEINAGAPRPKCRPDKKAADEQKRKDHKHDTYQNKRNRSICVTIATGLASRKERRTRSDSS